MRFLLLLSVGVLMLWTLDFGVRAQGTILFTNDGEGIDSQVELSSTRHFSYSAELVIEESGIRIAGPTRFSKFSSSGLGEFGIFSGGVVAVPGIPPGERLTVRLAVSSAGGIVGVSEPFEIVLGGIGSPPSLPGRLVGLERMLVGFREFYWNSWLGRSCDRIPGNGSILIDIAVDDSSCIAEDEKFKAIEGLVTSQELKLDYAVDSIGNIELKWPAGSSAVLFGSSTPTTADAKRVTGDVYSEGYRVKIIPAQEPKMFYWLSESN